MKAFLILNSSAFGGSASGGDSLPAMLRIALQAG